MIKLKFSQILSSLGDTFDVRVEVGPADPAVVNFINGVVERCFEDPVPDVIPHTDPSAIEFSHVFLEADSERDACNRGWKMLPPRKRGTVANDYVVVSGK
jgi:hypothetical protein